MQAYPRNTVLARTRNMASTDGPADHHAIETCAAAWLARRDSGEWSSEDEAGLTEWLNEATAHRVAFLRLEYVWEGARRAQVLSALPPGVVPAGQWRQSPFFQASGSAAAATPSRGRVWPFWIAAASFVLVVGLGMTAYIFNWFGPGSVYSTSVGAISSVPLADGSIVTLDTASRIRVEFEPKERRVILEKGEAYFVVKKNLARPFIVTAGDQRIVDVGTQFSVRRDTRGIQVVVTEGTVQFESSRASARSPSGSLPTSLPQGPPESDVPLSAGTIALAQDGDVLVHQVTIRQAEELVSWHVGYLTFDYTRLADAVAEFNRYNEHLITIESPKVADIRISGTFRPTNYEAFTRLLQEAYGIGVHETDRGTTLSE